MPRLGGAAAMIANSLWTVVLQIAFIPIYIRLLGPEGFGLIGVSMVIRAILLTLDFGIIATINRELARLLGSSRFDDERGVIRTSEVWIATTTGLTSIVVVAAAPAIAAHWINASDLGQTEVVLALRLMAVAAGLNVLTAFYQSALMGLHRHTAVAAWSAGSSTLVYVGSVAVLLIERTAIAYFVFQAIAAALQLTIFALLLYRVSPLAAGRFQMDTVSRFRPFALGIAGTSIAGTLLAQTDKLVLTRMLSLEVFGYYTVASGIAGAILMLAGPVFSVVYPSLSAAVAKDDKQALRRAYQEAVGLMSLVVIPVGAVLSVFSFEILRLWTHDSVLTEKTGTIAAVLVLGTAVNSLMVVPYSLLLAHGKSRVTFVIAASLMTVFLPALIFATAAFGPIGAATTWLGLNVAYMFVGVPLAHSLTLRGETMRWIVRGLGLPAIAAFGSALTWATVAPISDAPRILALRIGVAALLCLVATAAVLPDVWGARRMWRSWV